MSAKISDNGCELCIDPDGLPCLPMYGSPPHESFRERNGKIDVLHKETGEDDPDFVPNPEEPGMGTWYCSTEGCPNSKKEQEKKNA